MVNQVSNQVVVLEGEVMKNLPPYLRSRPKTAKSSYCYLSGKMRKHYIKILPGDKVRLRDSVRYGSRPHCFPTSSVTYIYEITLNSQMPPVVLWYDVVAYKSPVKFKMSSTTRLIYLYGVSLESYYQTPSHRLRSHYFEASADFVQKVLAQAKLTCNTDQRHDREQLKKSLSPSSHTSKSRRPP
jgi:translation initiation factor IF-1